MTSQTLLSKRGAFLTFCLLLEVIANHTSFQLEQNSKDLELSMPGATSSGKDSYRCASFSMKDQGTLFISQFTANANASKAHHIILQKCPQPMQQPGIIWDCNHHAICAGGSHVLYAWAKNAQPTKLPNDVAFKVDPSEFIVMQIHYANPFNEPDHTSVTIKVTPTRPKYYAGIYLLWKSYKPIPPKQSSVDCDINCIVKGVPPMHIFAFRPHAHSLGRRVLGVKKDHTSGEINFFANGDPQKPQAFYPLAETITLNEGDTIFARCVYNSMEKEHVTNIGSTAGDEMCNLYLMYYNEVDNQDFIDCSREEDAKMSQLASEAIGKADAAGKSKEGKNFPILSKKSHENPLIGHKFKFDAQNVGDICGLTFDVYGNVVILNRGNHRWDFSTFSWGNEYKGDRNSPIAQDTVITYNSSGHVISSWGRDQFFLPHMITIDAENNVWITDVAMHQVFKFGPYGGVDKKPLIELGTKFQPGSDDLHYCKPTAVAVMSDSRTFFVSDGYCNQRIIKYAIRSIGSNGYHSVIKLMSIDAMTQTGTSNAYMYTFNVPHALALFEEKQSICVADRENGVVKCFDTDSGLFKVSVPNLETMSKIYSIDSFGSELAVLGGPNSASKSKLFIHDLNTTESTEAIMEKGSQYLVGNPHDVAVSKDGETIMVANLNPPELWLFDRKQVAGTGRSQVMPVMPLTMADEERSQETLGSKDGMIWQVMLLLIAVGTGAVFISLYRRKRKIKDLDGFQPLTTEDYEEDP